MNPLEIISLVLNLLLASGLLGTFLFFRSKRRQAKAEADNSEIVNTEKIVHLQAEQIDRLDARVEKLEQKVDKLEQIIRGKDAEIDRNRTIIRQAYKCSVPQDDCPVLIKKRDVERGAPAVPTATPKNKETANS